MQNPFLETTTPSPEHRKSAYAPWWHTLLLVLWILFTSWSTARGINSSTAASMTKSSRYIETMIMQWLVLLYVWFGLFLRGRKLREILGHTWKTFEDALLDIAIAAGFWLTSNVVLLALQAALKMASQQSIRDRLSKLGFIAPRTGHELALFFCVAITAGICEEIIFRGYLQRQFIYASRSAVAGIVLSAALFGLAHGYQGPKSMLVLGCYGALFGTMAHFRRSVIPGMITHAWQDSFTGAMLYFLKYLPVPK